MTSSGYQLPRCDARDNKLDDHDRELSSPGSQPVTVTMTVGSRRWMFRDRDREPVSCFLTRGLLKRGWTRDLVRPSAPTVFDKILLLNRRWVHAAVVGSATEVHERIGIFPPLYNKN